MRHQPFDARYWHIQQDTVGCAMPLHRAGFETPMMSQGGRPALLHSLLQQFENWADRNCPPAWMNRILSALALQRKTHPNSEQSRIGHTIHLSSKVL